MRTSEMIATHYAALRRLARQRLRVTRGDPQPTSLVHGAILRLRTSDSRTWANAGAFLACAARAMRSLLVDAARRRIAGRRAVEERCRLMRRELPDVRLLHLDRAIARLEAEDSVAGRLVTLRCFGGQTVEDAAAQLGMSRRSGYRVWEFARAWLTVELDRMQADTTDG